MTRYNSHRILLDLDGLLVDFASGWLRKKGLVAPSPWPVGEMKFNVIFNIPEEEVMVGLDIDFWETLPKMSDATAFLSDVEMLVGIENILLITSIVSDPISSTGKIKWIQRNFPRYMGSYLITPARHRLATSRMILIDDQTTHVGAFKSYGGHAITYPRHWNERVHIALQGPQHPHFTVINELRSLLESNQ